MLLHDAVANAQPKPGTFSHILGCVERIEDAFGVEKPGSTVVELDTYSGIMAINPHSQDATSFALLDCVHRIVDDVKEHLFELVRVSNHGRKIGSHLAFQNNIAALQIVFPQNQRVLQHAGNIYFDLLGLALSSE